MSRTLVIASLLTACSSAPTPPAPSTPGPSAAEPAAADNADPAQASPGVLCRADEVLYEGCALPDGSFFAACTRAAFADRFDTTPPYLAVRTGKKDVMAMEYVADAQHPIERRFTRHAGANTRHALRWTHQGKQHMYESSYLDGNRLHALTSVVDGKLDVTPCSDHAPGQASLLTSDEFSTWGE